jgi:uroporphyrinogen decarboxylase
MNGKERISRILRHEPVDRIGLFEVFWGETVQAWTDQGRIESPEAVSDHFGLDLRRTSGEVTPLSWKVVNLVADLDASDDTVEENETSRLSKDGNGALLRWLKHGSGAPEHVDFTVKDRQGWEEQILPRLLDERSYDRRIDFDRYRELRSKCARDGLFMTCGAVAAFDLMSPMCGHENLLVGMALDAEWVSRMAMTYTDVTIRLLEKLFEREGLPDGMWVWDDLGFKAKPFMSPAMYRELIFPAHKRLFDFAHARGLPVIMHCDGFVEALIPQLIEAGIDCLQPIEIKAGMDLLRIKRDYGEKIALIGGMDINVLETNDLARVDAELERKLPAAMAGSGYVLQCDHSVSSNVEYATYSHFVERGLEIGRY